MPNLAEICPSTIDAKLIRLSIGDGEDASLLSPRVGSRTTILADYSACDPDGVVLPLELSIQPPTRANWELRVFRLYAPKSVLWIPREHGLHSLVLRERYHNFWRGSLTVEVLDTR